MSQIDDITGKGWDYKPADTGRKSRLLLLMKNMTISVDLTSLLLKFTASYTVLIHLDGLTTESTAPTR